MKVSVSTISRYHTSYNVHDSWQAHQGVTGGSFRNC
uniref:Uncharacterized protein n=1 Tax=Arundo donax TaxID=35708 RepID=A0A0A9B6R1_ARUDO